MKLEAMRWLGVLALAAIVTFGISFGTYAAISSIMGVAAFESGTTWNNVRDGAAGDTLSRGVLGTALYIYNGTTFDRVRGTGGTVNVSGASAVGTSFYAIERANITTASVNLAFSITSKKIKLITPLTNTDDICVDYAGGTAACPAANTAGNDRLKPGTSLLLDGFQATSVSVIAGSGTQTVQVAAWQ